MNSNQGSGRSTPLASSSSSSTPQTHTSIPRQVTSPLGNGGNSTGRPPLSFNPSQSFSSRPSSSPPFSSNIPPPPGLFSLPPSPSSTYLRSQLRSGGFSFSATPPAPVLSNLNAASRPGSGHGAGPQNQHAPSTRARMGSTAANTRLSPGEWSFFGIDIPINGVRALADEAASTMASSVGDLGRRSNSAFGDKEKEIFHASFGGDRWKLELVKAAPEVTSPVSPTPGSSTGTSSKLSLYLFLDTAFQPVYDTRLMFGIREPNEAIGRRDSKEGWLWQIWDDHCFGTETDFFQCDTFPSFDELLQNPRISELDSLVLSIQIQSPASSPVPQLQESHHIPLDLFAGLEALLDDRATGDVVIYCHERQPGAPVRSHSHSGTDITSHSRSGSNESDDQSPNQSLYRKRVLYAHGAILKSRSGYFKDLLTSGWEETCGGSGSADERRKAKIKIEDFDYTTVYWLLHFLYTNQITFQPTEDVRLLPTEDLPDGWLSSPERFSWDYFSINALAHSFISTLGDISETNREEDVEDQSLEDPEDSTQPSTASSTTASAKSLGKRRVNSSPSAASVQPKRRPMSPDIPPSQNFVNSSAAGRISPLGGGGRLSPTSARASPRRTPHSSSSTSSPTNNSSNSPIVNPHGLSADPHSHPPTNPILPASALAIYKLADRYSLPTLANLALCHLIQTLTPRTAFPLLLSTHLWPELNGAIKNYAYSHYFEISREAEFERCYKEVGEGLWENGGEVLLDFTMNLTPIWTQ